MTTGEVAQALAAARQALLFAEAATERRFAAVDELRRALTGHAAGRRGCTRRPAGATRRKHGPGRTLRG